MTRIAPKRQPAVLLWHSGLKIWCFHCNGSGHCCGLGSIPGLGNAACCGCGQERKSKVCCSMDWKLDIADSCEGILQSYTQFKPVKHIGKLKRNVILLISSCQFPPKALVLSRVLKKIGGSIMLPMWLLYCAKSLSHTENLTHVTKIIFRSQRMSFLFVKVHSSFCKFKAKHVDLEIWNREQNRFLTVIHLVNKATVFSISKSHDSEKLIW